MVYTVSDAIENEDIEDFEEFLLKQAKKLNKLYDDIIIGIEYDSVGSVFQVPVMQFIIYYKERQGDDTHKLATCNMSVLVEQCGTVVFSNILINDEMTYHKEKKLAILKIFEEVAKILGFGTILTTTNDSQNFQNTYFPLAGYERVNSSKNPRSMNLVRTFIKNI